jgi:hypothetical protein
MRDPKFVRARGLGGVVVCPVILKFRTIVETGGKCIESPGLTVLMSGGKFSCLGDLELLNLEDLTKDEVEGISKYYKLRGYYRTSRVIKHATTETIKYLRKREFYISRQLSEHSLGTKWPEVENGRKLLYLMKNSPEKLITEYFNVI